MPFWLEDHCCYSHCRLFSVCVLCSLKIRESARYDGRFYFFNLKTNASEWSLSADEIEVATEGDTALNPRVSKLKGSMSTNALSQMTQEIPTYADSESHQGGTITPSNKSLYQENKYNIEKPSTMKHSRSMQSFEKLTQATCDKMSLGSIVDSSKSARLNLFTDDSSGSPVLSMSPYDLRLSVS